MTVASISITSEEDVTGSRAGGCGSLRGPELIFLTSPVKITVAAASKPATNAATANNAVRKKRRKDILQRPRINSKGCINNSAGSQTDASMVSKSAYMFQRNRDFQYITRFQPRHQEGISLKTPAHITPPT